MITNPFIFPVLDVSTAHMTVEDNQRLQASKQSDDCLPAYELSEYGWLCYVGEIEENWDKMSPAFLCVMRAAKELKCDYVRFDRDGREYPELQKFDW